MSAAQIRNAGYLPYSPLNVPKPVAPDVWIVDGPEIGLKFSGLTAAFPTRMTIVRLPEGRLWLHSPTQPDSGLVKAVSKLGTVDFLIAPNTLHYWWIPDWKQRFPDAAVYAVPTLERSAKRPVPIDHTIGEAPPPEWSNAFDQVLVQGKLLTEADFLHRESRTLILTDLIENFELSRVRSWVYRWLIRLGGAADPDGKAPLDMRMSFLVDREPVRQAVQKMRAWRPERIIFAHGRWYENNAASEFERAFRWAS